MTGGAGRILRVGDVAAIRRSRLTCDPDHSNRGRFRAMI
jgi:hypothetical protein